MVVKWLEHFVIPLSFALENDLKTRLLWNRIEVSTDCQRLRHVTRMMSAEPVVWGQRYAVKGCPPGRWKLKGLVWLWLWQPAREECSLSPAVWKELEAVGTWGLMVSSLPLHEKSWPFAWFTLQMCITSLFLFSSGVLPWRAFPECDFSVSVFRADHAEI